MYAPFVLEKWTFLRRLGVRLILFLSLALIPVGLLAVLQSNEVIRRINAQTEARLAAETREAARTERQTILWAIGAAEGLGHMVRATGDADPGCADLLHGFTQLHAAVRTIGYVRPNGQMLCASNGATFDFSDDPSWHDMLSDPRQMVEYRPNGEISGGPVLVTTVPMFDDDTFLGAVFISQPYGQLMNSSDGIAGATFMTFNPDGEVLTSSDGTKVNNQLLPRDRSLATLASEKEVTFTGYSKNGARRVYSVSPIIHGTVYAIGVWAPDASGESAFGMAVSIPLFPLLMWVTSLVVAYAAVDRLALRHIRRLRSEILRFAATRRVPGGGTADMPLEIYEIYETFLNTSETIIQDEAELEQLVHDKNVLLKEVHHRVKNNLQLISSIMNMQMRKMKSPEAKNALRRLQSRVLSLATIHRNLYKTQNLGAVTAGPLLEQLVNQLTGLAASETHTRVSTKFDPITLYPDQAVPVSLLTTEAVTNALKHAGNNRGEPGWLEVSLIDEGEGWARFSVTNSKGPVPIIQEEGVADGSGLGTNLIRAFATQLEASAEIEDTDDHYRLSCRFEVHGFSDEAPADETDDEAGDKTGDAPS